MQLGSPNLTQKCSTVGAHLFCDQKVKGQGHETQNPLPAWVTALLRVLASSSWYNFQFENDWHIRILSNNIFYDDNSWILAFSMSRRLTDYCRDICMFI